MICQSINSRQKLPCSSQYFAVMFFSLAFCSTRPWDSMTDCIQYEKDHVISTQTVHTVSPVRQTGWQGPRARQKKTSSGSPPGTPSSTAVSVSASRQGRWKPRVTDRQKNNEDEDGSSTGKSIKLLYSF